MIHRRTRAGRFRRASGRKDPPGSVQRPGTVIDFEITRDSLAQHDRTRACKSSLVGAHNGVFQISNSLKITDKKKTMAFAICIASRRVASKSSLGIIGLIFVLPVRELCAIICIICCLWSRRAGRTRVDSRTENNVFFVFIKTINKDLVCVFFLFVNKNTDGKRLYCSQIDNKYCTVHFAYNLS